jgi:hypothetical protein
VYILVDYQMPGQLSKRGPLLADTAGVAALLRLLQLVLRRAATATHRLGGALTAVWAPDMNFGHTLKKALKCDDLPTDFATWFAALVSFNGYR